MYLLSKDTLNRSNLLKTISNPNINYIIVGKVQRTEKTKPYNCIELGI